MPGSGDGTSGLNFSGQTEEVEAFAEILDSGEAGGKIIRGGAIRSASYVGGILLGLISTPFMVRHLGVIDFGRYVAVTSLVFIVSGLTEGGLTAIGVREYSVRNATSGASLIRSLLGIRLVLTGVGVGGAVVFALAAGYTHVMVVGAAIAGLGLLLSNYHGAFYVPLSVRLRLGRLAAIDLLRAALTSVLAILLVVAGATLLPFFAIPVAVGIVATGVALWLVKGMAPWVPSFRPEEWKDLLRDSIPYAAATAIGVLYFRVAVILMSVISSDQATGFYGLAFRIIEIVSGVPWLLVSAALPILTRAAKADTDRMQYTMQRLFEVALILGVWVALAIGLGSPFAVRVIGGQTFDRSITPLAVLGTAMIGTFLVAVWGHGLLAMRRNVSLLGANLSAFVLGVVLTLVLAPTYGALGGAVATTATELWLALVYGALLVRYRPDLRPKIRLLGPLSLASAIAVAPPLLASTPPIVSLLIATVLYFGILAVCRAIPAELVNAFKLER
jgi:O-antigen/teichoic acid export membrane protein